MIASGYARFQRALHRAIESPGDGGHLTCECWHAGSVRTRSFLESILQEDVEAIIYAALKAFVIGSPAQVIRANDEIATGCDAIGEIESPVARAPAVRNVLIHRVVG